MIHLKRAIGFTVAVDRIESPYCESNFLDTYLEVQEFLCPKKISWTGRHTGVKQVTAHGKRILYQQNEPQNVTYAGCAL